MTIEQRVQLTHSQLLAEGIAAVLLPTDNGVLMPDGNCIYWSPVRQSWMNEADKSVRHSSMQDAVDAWKAARS